jgi:UDP-2,4-diacetamido-2,4,6-trideoxy-beta-L-altropyranose hydrolase
VNPGERDPERKGVPSGRLHEGLRSIVFRTDSSAVIGTGHLSRSINLAREFEDRGFGVHFIVRDHRSSDYRRLEALDYTVHRLPPSTSGRAISSSDESTWLSVPVEEDAKQTKLILDQLDLPQLVVDHYGIDASWEERVRSSVSQLITIDDSTARTHVSDIVVYSSFNNADPLDLENGIVQSNGQIRLVGLRYAPLSAAYSRSSLGLRGVRESVEHVVVFFGGVDVSDLIIRVVKCLKNHFSNLTRIDVIAGGSKHALHFLTDLSSESSVINVCESKSSLLESFQEADIAVGAGGVAALERLAVGLPSVNFVLSENQRYVTESLAKAGALIDMGPTSSFSEEVFLQVFTTLASDVSLRSQMSVAGQLIVDGWGARRLAEVVDPCTFGGLRLRKCQRSDLYTLFSWANDRSVRENSISTSSIDLDGHTRWFSEKISNPTTFMFVLESKGLPVGQIRFEVDGTTALINYSLDPLVRGRGWGRFLVDEGIRVLRELVPVQTLRARVRVSNPASLRIFSGLNFVEVSRDDGLIEFSLAKSDPTLKSEY